MINQKASGIKASRETELDKKENDQEDSPQHMNGKMTIHSTSLRQIYKRIPLDQGWRFRDTEINTLEFTMYYGYEEIKEFCSKVNQYQRLHKWRIVESLRIVFLKTFHIPDETVKRLAQLLKNSFCHLIKFQVTFVDCYELTDQGLETLSQITRHLPWLKELEIEYASQPYLSGQGLRRMGFEVSRNLRNIEKLSLILSECYTFEDKDMDLLFQGFGNYFQKLKCFELNLDYSELITNAGVEIIVHKISQHFKSLQKFELSLVGCDSIDYDKLGHISGIFSFIPGFILKTRHTF